MKIILALLLAACFVCLGGASAGAAELKFGLLDESSATKGTSRAIHVEEKVRNDRPAFLVRVDVDRPDRVYEDSVLIKATVMSEKNGYLYLLNRLEDGKLVCLFPNKHRPDNRIEAHRAVVVPQDSDDFNLRVGPPFGTEALIAVVSLEPLAASAFGAKSLTNDFPTPVEPDALIANIISVEEKKRSSWAEHHVVIKTVAKRATVPSGAAKRRLGLFVGISEYQDERVRDLHVCHTDAEVVYNAMKQHGRLTGGCALTNQNATLAKICQAVASLKEQTNPGDEIFIFWSGHGARCADEDGDEKDGYDEYLVPYDARLGELDTVLLDDTFGRWIQDLDGRRVVVILDTCHSGGISATTKGADQQAELPGGYFDFVDSELARTKDVGQKDAAMLCSSDSHEVSVERREGDLSVMTYFLWKQIQEGPSVTLTGAYDRVKVEVPEYVKNHFHRQTQTPILVNEFGTIYLRP